MYHPETCTFRFVTCFRSVALYDGSILSMVLSKILAPSTLRTSGANLRQLYFLPTSGSFRRAFHADDFAFGAISALHDTETSPKANFLTGGRLNARDRKRSALRGFAAPGIAEILH